MGVEFKYTRIVKLQAKHETDPAILINNSWSNNEGAMYSWRVKLLKERFVVVVRNSGSGENDWQKRRLQPTKFL
jgi:hypothetical protein